ncbi:FAD/NAD(P)-binding domain-containing protein [Aspergillus eucalypticola CBS 122712]|uniref:FAD/NAD(P)-binding domain-containing protein n=1 Tax=Aspergillus eucalypticola (strain CBS 122712 / IBT 29274) TaxID=1448314 RepID=A0A317VN26_ASPEC|nr:FAD/NAD(P)-binding domain-containing protein [Aspergillus eucalypticola CBS 122712]PWY75726.1 FAD/NAD(P)-binding domain-containing protein [Aspergillus eucalypticola CBS 122712]
MCKKLTDQGLSVKVIEAAPDMGGTWYWNRYPGALSDTRSYFYRYSWDLEDLREYPWKREFLKQPEILAYLRHVVDRHDLRKYMQSKTQVQRAIYDDVDNLLTVSLSAGPRLTARYIVTAVGLLSKINYPGIPGLKTFEGEMYHTGNRPASYDFTGKRVGVIGNGSTGVQLVTALADQNVKQLLSFQRHPQYVVPAGDAEEQVWGEVRNSVLGFGFEESSKPTFSVSEEERERIFEDAWAKDEEANKAAAEFICRKIRQMFNRPNVDVVNIGTNPITRLLNKGIRTADGSEYELDILIIATGFDAVDGNYKRMHIQGVLGKTLKDRWKQEPSSFLGTCIPGFPILFTVLGPNGPFTNIPRLFEIQVEFISDMISHARKVAAAKSAVNGSCVEVDTTELQAWMRQCDEASANSLFRKTPSWIFGANVAGKRPSVLFYFGGLATYR